MIERLKSLNNPNLFFLNYDSINFEIKIFFIIPKYFFIPDIIEKRNPLKKTARRAGWIGCNILLNNVPNTGKIFYIKNKQISSKITILKNWKKTQFLKTEKNITAKKWILDIMYCIDVLNKKEFSLSELYSFEAMLSQKHPDNKHIKEKIRQQIQILRDKTYLEFISKGVYRLS